MRNLVVDLNNLAFAARHNSGIKPAVSVRRKEPYVKEKIFANTVGSILYHAAKFSCSGLVLVLDSKNVWRKDIYPEYKANHEPADDVYYSDVIEAIEMMRDFFTEFTAALCFSVKRCEADDLMAFWCRNSTVENVILSTDKDFIQLIDQKTKLYSPVQKVFRETTDSQYDLFVKIIRGDRGDYIYSAFPKVRETRLKKAWDDELEMLNLMEEVIDGVKVSERFELNMRLIDLNEQPIEIKVDIHNAINKYVHGKYVEHKAMKFLKENNLGAMTNMFSGRDICLKNKPIFKHE